MEKLNTGKRVIDLGCGTGQLVIDLLEAGYDAIGVDGSPEMVAQARDMLTKKSGDLKGLEVFQAADVTNLHIEDSFDVVTAVGLIEYLEDDLFFFKTVYSLMKKGGVAFVECRNRLFNIASANKYTLDVSDSRDLNELISQLDCIEKYSPIPASGTTKIQAAVFKEIAEHIGKEHDINIPTQDAGSVVKEYPVGMIRKQHTPKELEDTLEKTGLRLKYVVYYHYHPYLPRYEKLFPVTFNTVSLLMQPLGYTPLGSTTCSAFVAVIEKC